METSLADVLYEVGSEYVPLGQDSDHLEQLADTKTRVLLQDITVWAKDGKDLWHHEPVICENRVGHPKLCCPNGEIAKEVYPGSYPIV